MKLIRILKNITLAELITSLLLGIIVMGSMAFESFKVAGISFMGIGILHIASMILHWLAWKQVPVTHNSRKVFNLWVGITFSALAITYFYLPPAFFVGLYLLLLFAIAWYVFYCYILFKEFRFLKHKRDLYEKRELIHF